MNPELQERSNPVSIKNIDTSTKEGKWLFAALSIITSESRTSETPDQVLGYIEELQKEMFA